MKGKRILAKVLAAAVVATSILPGGGSENRGIA